jgi:hypothetical protein
MSSSFPALRLGELLHRAGLLPRAWLDNALKRQAKRDVRLGALLIEMGLLDQEELDTMLAMQSELRKTGGAQLSERLLIGRLLVDAGIIDPATLEQALGRSRRSGRRIGETLVETGAISAEVLQRFLRRQSRLSAFAMAGVALSAALHAGTAAADQGTLAIHATVMSRASIEGQRLPQHVVVSAADVAQGYVEVEEPVEIAIRSNIPAGVVIGFTLNSPQLQGVDVRSAQGGELRAAGVFVPQGERGLRTSSVSLRLRLLIAPAAQPGPIAFPLTVFLTPG